MSFADQLKELRKSHGMSQETLADKLNVSRQAVTKWETERGMPEVENIIEIAHLFNITIDELLTAEKGAIKGKSYLYESVTEYDIDEPKKFDVSLDTASMVKIRSTDGEKLLVNLYSNEIETLSSNMKVKIDDVRSRIDINLKRLNDISITQCKQGLVVEVVLPEKYIYDCEFAVNTHELVLSELNCEDVEFDGKIEQLTITNVQSHVEVNCNLDMLINVDNFTGKLDINQISSTSRMYLPKDLEFATIAKGIKTAISYEFDYDEALKPEDVDTIIELNGFKSELVIGRHE
ncbi:MAG: helix-turn-helix transcriptional regulator [Erysipelotrichaceae bacterium]|nr:helix-turn-helix transcriptional regulator [Erysipelotrichaceae bacterium]